MAEFDQIEQDYSALHHVPVGVCLLRNDLMVMFWSDCLENWTKISKGDIVGKSICEFFPHLFGPIYEGRLSQIFEGGPPTIFSSELHKHLFPARLPNGELQIQHTIVKAVKSEATGPWHAMVMVQDVTDLSRQAQNYRLSRDQAVKEIQERKRAEAEREELNIQLRESSRQAGMAEVAIGVLHNIGNILTSVNVSVGMVRKIVKQASVEKVQRTAELIQQHAQNLGEFFTHDPKGQQIPEYLTQLGAHLIHEHERIDQEVQGLTTNIEHINQVIQLQQTFARSSSGHQESLELYQIMEQALYINIASLERHAITVIRKYEDIPSVVTDRHQVLQILVNLISNAKYAVLAGTGDSRHIMLKIGRVKGHEGMVFIQVEDTGVGIKPEHLTQIFAQGFTTKIDGHGFGLHGAALSAKNIGGSLTVHSDGEGCGATFRLELPVKCEEGVGGRS